VLGVRAGASEQEIKQEYRRLAKLWHPDHFTVAPPDLRARAERRMQALNRAYAVLSDPVRKVAYDQRRLHSQYGAEEWHTDWQADAFGFSSGPVYDSRTPNESSNPNGAGMLAGTLCLILAVGTLWRISSYGFLVGIGPILGFAGFIGLLVLAGYLFDARSPVARAVRGFLEHDPRRRFQNFALRQDWRDSRHTSEQSSAGSESELQPTTFEKLVDDALSDIPSEFEGYLDNVVVQVKPDPSPEELKRMQVRPCNLLLGLYEGVPLIHQRASGHPPEVITIFQHSIESYCHDDPDRIRHQVRATVFHELAHHFGMSHEEMPAWVK
jgi:predicted Zn-dependent protease with MMP-like domain